MDSTMKATIIFISIVNLAACSLIHNPGVLSTSVVRSGRIGDSFAYSTFQGNTYLPTLSTGYAYPGQLYTTSIFASPIYSQLLNQPSWATQNPILGVQGINAQNPIFGAQNPIFGVPGQGIGAQNPIFGVPGQGIGAQNPILGVPGQTPGQPAVEAPVQSPIGGAVPGATLDDDSVSVEAAY